MDERSKKKAKEQRGFDVKVSKPEGFKYRVEIPALGLLLDCFDGAVNRSALEEVGSFRYEMYVDKLGYMNASRFDDEVELDDWDRNEAHRRSTHLFLRADGQGLGYVRLLSTVVEGDFGSVVPASDRFDCEFFLDRPQEYWDDVGIHYASRNSAVEVSRLLLDPDHKKYYSQALDFLFSGVVSSLAMSRKDSSVISPQFLIGNMRLGLLQYLQKATGLIFSKRAVSDSDINYDALISYGSDWVAYFRNGTVENSDPKKVINLFAISVDDAMRSIKPLFR